MASPVARDLPLDAHAQFRREVRALAPLTETEEADLWTRAAVDPSARHRLVEGYQPLVLAHARRLQPRCQVLELLDLAQEGTLGVLHALSAHTRRTADMPLRAWASCWIRSAMLQAIYRNERVLRLPDRTRKRLRRLVGAQVEILEALGREATIDELARKLGRTAQDITELLLLQAQRFVSLDTPVRTGETLAPLDTLACAESRPNEAVSRLHYWLRRFVAQLPKRERAVVTLRYGFNGDAARSTREVAMRLDLPLAVVQDIDRRVRLRIRVAMGRAGFPPDGFSAVA
jgi:RNA polymerase sigma factor (sigma-70 family)